MTSYQITITPSKRAAGRFVSRVRRMIQKALAEEENARGLTQSDIARAIGVNRSVISREIRGHKDLGLSRVAELAWAMGRKPSFSLPSIETTQSGSNVPVANNTVTSAFRHIYETSTTTVATKPAANTNFEPTLNVMAN